MGRSSRALPTNYGTVASVASNVSLDTLEAAKFRAITRWGRSRQGSFWPASRPRASAGLAVKINAVALKGLNEEEIPSLMEWAHGKGMALTLIEVMPMGDIGEGRIDQYVPLSLLRAPPCQAIHADRPR